ncbi:MAG: hypothetical protein ACXVP5_01095 [Tumebacillaceae bacterium]
MANKWKQEAQKLVGQHVVVRDTKGKMHNGILQKIQKDGIQIRPMGGGAGMAAAERQNADMEQAIATRSDAVEGEETFFLGAFLIAWALIAGLWGWGAYGGYGYGYGAPYAYGVPVRAPYRRAVVRRGVPPYRRYW